MLPGSEVAYVTRNFYLNGSKECTKRRFVQGWLPRPRQDILNPIAGTIVRESRLRLLKVPGRLTGGHEMRLMVLVVLGVLAVSASALAQTAAPITDPALAAAPPQMRDGAT